MKSAVIFGGAGFIGRHLTHRLLEHGTGEVLLCDVSSPKWEVPRGARYVQCDVRRAIPEMELGESVGVFNLAAIHRTPGHEDREYHETNELGARNVVAFCSAHGIQDLWFTSSIAVYGPSEQPIEESTPPSPSSAYGRSKLEAEAIHRDWAAQMPGRRLVVVRPGTVFGPGEGGNFTRLAQTLKSRRFAYPGRSDTVKACGYVGDLVESLIHMRARADPVALYNFSYGPPPTIQDVCEAFHAAGLPRPLGTVPLPLILMAATTLQRLGLESFRPERVQKLARSTYVVPTELTRSGFQFKTTIDSALQTWRDAAPVGEFV